MGWILPTHGRPEKCAAVLQRIKDIGCETPGVVIVNGGDIEAYKRLVTPQLPAQWALSSVPTNLGCCPLLNIYNFTHRNEPWYGLICDDEFVETPGWDLRLVAAAGSRFVANANDRWQSERRVHACPVIGGELARAVGMLTIPGTWHWAGFDCFWETICERFQLRRFCPDVFVEHRHPLNRKATMDETARLASSRALQDMRRFHNWHAHDWPRLAARLVRQFGLLD